MEERYIAAIDLGSSKIALTVAKVSGHDIQVLFYREKPSAGIRNSAVFNPQKASGPIWSVISEAEKELKIKIMQVVVGLPRCDVRQEINQARVERTHPEESITAEEVEALKSLAQDEYPLSDPDREELYGAVAQSYSDDENFQMIESDIIGVISATFEGNFKLFIGKKSSVRTIDKVFNDLGIAVARKYFTPDAIARAVLTEEEMNGGVALVDLGGGATSVTIYKGKVMRYYASIPFGGKNVTTDIQSECTISETLAENIKLAFGACQPDRLQNLGEKIIQIEGDSMDGLRQIPVQYLSEIITAREREIVDAILWEIEQSGLADSLRSGIVITGGAAGMTNLGNMIRDISGYTVRQGLPRHLFSASGCPGVFSTSATTSLGMVIAAQDDPSISCLEEPPVQEEEEEPAEEEVAVAAAEVAEEPATEAEAPAEPEAPAAEENAANAPSSLFGTEVEKEVTVKKERAKKHKEPKKPHLFSITWGKLTQVVGNLYDKSGNDNQEDNQL